jgi:hypothetical protein
MRVFQSIPILVGLFAAAAPTAAVQAPKSPPTTYSSSELERRYAGENGIPSRRTQTRTESNGREVVTEKTELPDVDGRMKMSLETTTETVRTGANSTQTKHDVFVPDGQGRTRLLETSQRDVQILGAGSSRSVTNTWAPDLNGRLNLSGQQVEETKTLSPNVTQTDTAIYKPGVNQPMQESERLQKTETKVSNALTQTESTRFLRDGNGKWQAAETRSEEVRTSGAELVAEQTVRKVNVNGKLEVSEKTVTTQTRSNGRDEKVVENYAQNVEGIVGAGNRLELNQRVRSTVSATPDGAQQTIREVEGRSAVSPNGPLRVIERTIDTVRQVGPNQWEVQRQVFALDGNGRLVPVLSEKGQATGK